jgi:hypothetical protein
MLLGTIVLPAVLTLSDDDPAPASPISVPSPAYSPSLDSIGPPASQSREMSSCTQLLLTLHLSHFPMAPTLMSLTNSTMSRGTTKPLAINSMADDAPANRLPIGIISSQGWPSTTAAYKRLATGDHSVHTAPASSYNVHNVSIFLADDILPFALPQHRSTMSTTMSPLGE